MFNHIEFCLEEISWEIDAISATDPDTPGLEALRKSLADMRALVENMGTAGLAEDETLASVSSGELSGDDLTRIRGIDQATANWLAKKGCTQYSAIAAWTAGEIAEFADDEVSARRIARENWIEQAALLAAGEETHFTRTSASLEQTQTIAPCRSEMASAREPRMELDATSRVLATGLAVPNRSGSAVVIDFADRLRSTSAVPPAGGQIAEVVPFRRPARSLPSRALRAAVCLILALGIGLVTANVAQAPAEALDWALAAL